jgi:sulfate transport system permease protein
MKSVPVPILNFPWRGLMVTFLLLTLFPLLLMPIGAIFIFATRDGFSRFFTALAGEGAQFALRLSLMIALLTSILNSVLGTLTAYIFANYRFPAKRTLGILINLPVAIPTVVVGTSLLLLWGPIGVIGRYLDPVGFRPMFATGGILLAHLFVTFPYMLGAVKPVLDELEVTYEEAAYTMGAGRLRTFWYVILPSLRGALFTGTLLTFAHSLGEFGATVMVSGNLRLRTQTAPLYIFSQFEAGNIEAANAVAAVLATFSFIIFFILLRVTEGKQPRKG